MHETMALHTAARRYCMERAPALNPLHEEQWYQDRRWTRNRDLLLAWLDGRGTAAQIEFFGDLLFQIELVLPDEFVSLNALRSFLLTTARETVPPSDTPKEEREINQEREGFQTYIESLSVHDLHRIAPLPYRRVLKEPEVARMWPQIEQRWGITAKMYWYPLLPVALPSHVVAWHEEWFAYAISPDTLREMLREHGIGRVWELRQAGVPPQYEMDVAFLIPWCESVEHVWTSESMDWMMYTSHEHSITLGGQWLLTSIERIWPQWKEHLYVGFDHPRPPLGLR